MSFLICLFFFSIINLILLKSPWGRRFKSQCLALTGLIAFMTYLNLNHPSRLPPNTPPTLSLFIYIVFIYLIWFVVRHVHQKFKFIVSLILILVSMAVVRGYQLTFFWGYAYISLRLIWMLFETKDGLAAPSLTNYTAFVFYFPSLCVGPVFSFSHFKKQLEQVSLQHLPYQKILLRIFVGLTKLVIFATALHPLTASELVFSGFKMGVADHVVSIFCTYLYIYAAFSGTVDIAIACSLLSGVELPENFDSPIKALSISEFWTRWNISISAFFASHVFFPLQKSFQKRYRTLNLYSAPVFIFLTMFLMGLWHGFTLNFIIYGALHGVALALHSLYVRFKPLKNHPELLNSFFYRSCSWFLTHAFIALTLPFFMSNIFPI